MTLDILSPRGQQTLVEEQRAIDIFHRNIDGINMVQTIKDRASIVDGFLLTNGVVRAVVENKGRDMSLAQLERFNWEWLVTLDKVIESRRIARQLCVPLVGALYLIPDKTLLLKTLCDKDGLFMTHMRVATTETQATVNGGKALRSNAYIDMRKATRLT